MIRRTSTWSAHPGLIGRCPERFNSQLKFARRSAGIQQINSLGRSATRGNLGCNWRKKNPQAAKRRTAVLPRDARGGPSGDLPATYVDRESHLTASAGSPAGVLSEIAGSSLDTLILSAVISICRDLWDVMKTTMGYKT